MKKAFLPFSLAPIKSSLKRLGDKNDGGYLISYASLIQSDCLISFGLEENWSFENDFYRQKNIDIFCFDASVSKKHFRNKFLKNFFRIDKPHFFFKSLKNYLNYISFFSKSNHHHISKYVTFDRDPDHISFEKIQNEILSNYKNIFFKIDIEGSEYRILNQLVEIQEKISSLVIEFHDVDTHIESILDFSNRFNLPIINININNNGFISKNKIPTVIEVTYSNPDIINDFNDKNSINNINLEEVKIYFKN